jgi:hypothetical protein
MAAPDGIAFRFELSAQLRGDPPESESKRVVAAKAPDSIAPDAALE